MPTKPTHFNPWHNVQHGEHIPEKVNAIVEISKGSKAKYEVDKETGLLRLDRVLHTAFYYPINYGFIPQTYAGDGDPLDILVLSEVAIEPLCIVRTKVIGVMRMIDKGEDDKIISVCADDASVAHYNDISELPPHFLLELKHFFMRYKELEHKSEDVIVEEFYGKEKAFEIIHDAIASYKKEILPTLGA
jgi:inorganic pyrophosphatase